MWNQAGAIVWAQWRSTRNHFPRSNKAGLALTGLLTTVWYGVFAYLGVIAAILLSKPEEIESFHKTLPAALLLCFLYWQFIPILMASTGSTLELRKLMVYPIPKSQMFTLEVLLRITTAIEMLLLLVGASVGLLLNPLVPAWAPLSLVAFVAYNLLCSAGVRDLLIRMMAHKRIREVVILLIVLAAALPQALLFRGSPGQVGRFFAGEPSAYLPWTAAAWLALGKISWLSIAVLAGWTGAAYLFGRWQFERGLRFDAAEAASQGYSGSHRASRMEWFYRLPNVFFRDPLGALIEKELRFLSRTPRFRLVFVMGFSFGLLIWLPMAFGRRSLPNSFLAENYLTMVSVYALLLLSDVLFWNCFGFDRSAAQVYFLAPLKMSTVLAGKNLAAALWVLIEITAIGLVCALLRLPITGRQVVEAFLVTCVLAMFLVAIGNLSSLYMPRPVNPVKSFRTSASSRTQASLMLAFPVSLAPIGLAYAARYAFDTEWAFVGVLLFALALGGLIYHYTLQTAVQAASERREQIITALSRGEGPIES